MDSISVILTIDLRISSVSTTITSPHGKIFQAVRGCPLIQVLIMGYSTPYIQVTLAVVFCLIGYIILVID